MRIVKKFYKFLEKNYKMKQNFYWMQKLKPANKVIIKKCKLDEDKSEQSKFYLMKIKFRVLKLILNFGSNYEGIWYNF
jgi:hypothetical protein